MDDRKGKLAAPQPKKKESEKTNNTHQANRSSTKNSWEIDELQQHRSKFFVGY
jgi:hypothetical protein